MFKVALFPNQRQPSNEVFYANLGTRRESKPNYSTFKSQRRRRRNQKKEEGQPNVSLSGAIEMSMDAVLPMSSQ